MIPQILRTLLWAWPEGLNGNRSCPPTEFFSARAMKLHAFVDRFGSWIRTIPVGRDTSRGERERDSLLPPARRSDSGLGRHDPGKPLLALLALCFERDSYCASIDATLLAAKGLRPLTG